MGFRVEKVASVIREVVSEAIANHLSDPRISPFASVTWVDVAGDLQNASVHVSVMGEPGDERKTLAALQNAAGRIQARLARRLKVRNCPRLTFVPDPSIKKSIETCQLIDEAMAELAEPTDPHADPEAEPRS